MTFERIAVTEQQISDLGLPTAPVKPTDHRFFASASTTRAEALPPDTLGWAARVAGTLVTLTQNLSFSRMRLALYPDRPTI